MHQWLGLKEKIEENNENLNMQIFIPIFHTSKMAEPVVYCVNEVVGYKDRLYLITAITKTQGGFNRYTLEDIDSPDAYLAYKHELEKAQDVVLVECFSDELFGEDVAGGMGRVEARCWRIPDQQHLQQKQPDLLTWVQKK